ncbi:MAG: aminodeoxychorismate/anthranilate synthase component II [Dehalococcoidales bacterium]|nr:aminodeoxychorismate/anthranilate synthase component II [Dehalococcoidales bacterium]
MIVMIDNYDSFTYNLYQYFSELGEKVTVLRNNKTSIKEIEGMRPERLVISPGPSNPENAGISNEVIKYFSACLPILGVCLGHQCIGQVFGGEIVRAPEIMHGKASLIHHEGKGIFTGLPDPFTAIRYHSLIVKKENLPACLEITAATSDATIMGLKHRQLPVYGIQFHPESFMTAHGKTILRNFLEITANKGKKND